MNVAAEMGETTHSDTQRGSMRRFLPRGTQDACLVHIYPSGPDMGRRYPLAGRTVVLARVECDGDGYDVADLQSTNGTFVNDVPVMSHRLKDGDYVRVGNCIYRFLAGGNVEADYHEEIYRLTIMDALTETHNKRSLFQFLDH